MAPNRSILDWWEASFSREDKEWMVGAYQPLTVSASLMPLNAGVMPADAPLLRSLASITADDAARTLSNLATWFSKPGHEHCSIAFATKAMEFHDVDMPILDRHFALANQCIALYRWRKTQPSALEGAIAACEACIGIHLEAAVAAKAEFGMIPAHHCFRQLRIIEEKRGNFDKAIALCEQAKAGGWADDWDKDIARLIRKRDCKPKKHKPTPPINKPCDAPPEVTRSSTCMESSQPLPQSPQPQRWWTRIIRTVLGGRSLR